MSPYSFLNSLFVLKTSLSYVVVMIPRTRSMLQTLLWFAGDKIYTDVDDQSDPKYIRVCNERAIQLLKSTSITIGIIVATLNIYLGFPVYDTIFGEEFQLPVPVYVPFTDYSTVYGLTINILNNIFIAVVGLLGTIGVEIMTCMLKDTISATTVAVGYALQQLSDMLESANQKSSKTIDGYLRNILIQVQDYDR